MSSKPSPLPSSSQLDPLLKDTGIIPEVHPARTLVLCFDGTGDQFSADNSNVVLFCSLLSKGNRKEQMVYYQTGIGTYTTPQVATPFMSSISKTLDDMFAWNMDAHVMGGYEFLMENYQKGDKICLFGFSRGAYTACALAGMVHKVGLLPTGNHQQVPFAYKMFTRTDDEGWNQSTTFKKAFSMDVDIEFVGVWDTVCSVGYIPHTLPFTSSNTSIKTFRHALSLDEHRANFKANFFNKPTEAEQKLGTHPGDMPKHDSIPAAARPPLAPGSAGGQINGRQQQNNSGTKKRVPSQEEYERVFSEQEPKLETDVLEVWFAGCHCDVGGGSVANDSRHNLARIPLRWMIRQCFLTNAGIRFHAHLLRTVGLDPDTLWPTAPPTRPPAIYASAADIAAVDLHERSNSQATTGTTRTLVDIDVANSTDSLSIGYANAKPLPPGVKPLTEEEEDLADALCPIYDQLALAPSWWFLEFFPMVHRSQKADADWEERFILNLGKGREIPLHKQQETDFKMHRTVKIRMEAQNLPGGSYKPRAKYELKPEWVD